jgi:hypothetical protein
MVYAYRALEFFFLFPCVIFASINSYEKWSCGVCTNIVVLVALAGLLCWAEWRFLFVEFFEDRSVSAAIDNLWDMFYAPCVVCSWALITGIWRACSPCCCSACEYVCGKVKEGWTSIRQCLSRMNIHAPIQGEQLIPPGMPERESETAA